MQPKLPEQKHTPKGIKAWCVYCEEEREFAWDDRLGTARCPFCGITVYDFYIRQVNGLWHDGNMSRFERTVQKQGRRWKSVKAPKKT